MHIDPFHLDSEAWLRGWNEAYAPLPVLGGLASGDFTEQTTHQLVIFISQKDSDRAVVMLGGHVHVELVQPIAD